MVTANPDFAEQRRKLAYDFHRPTYHFVPPANWMNDPNGVIQWGGQFHVFYQHHPGNADFGLIHWGHAVSQDLIHWDDLPFALTPTPDSPDANGCWSGSAVDNNGIPTLIYTGVRDERYSHQTQCIATSDNSLLTWKKHPGNPVLSEIPAESGQTHDFRDPFVWREGDRWYLVLASRVVGGGGVVFLYRSPDLIHWEYMHPLLTGIPEKTGSVWECPSFFPLGDKWMLVVAGNLGAIPPTVFYFVGSYENHQFTPEVEGVLDHAYFYAPYTMHDDKNRRLLWGWLREGRSTAAHRAAGWAGAHAIPRELTIRNGQLHMEPIPELSLIRESQTILTNIQLSNQDLLLGIHGLALDITAEFELSGVLDLALACSPDGIEQTRITYDPAAKLLSVIRDQSSLVSGNETFPNQAPHELLRGETLQLRILLDGSVLEVIANGRTSICSRIYPTRADSQDVRVFGQGVLKSLTAWHMRSIWSE